MTKKNSKKPRIVNIDVIKTRMKELNLNCVDTALLVNIDVFRFKNVLGNHYKLKLSDQEIIKIAMKLKIKIKDLINTPEDAERLHELKRQEIINTEYQKYYLKYLTKEEPKLITNEKHISPVEVVRYPKKKYDPMKAKPLPFQPDDPNKTYRINRLGMKILVAENRCGVYCKYVTE